MSAEFKRSEDIAADTSPMLAVVKSLGLVTIIAFALANVVSSAIARDRAEAEIWPERHPTTATETAQNKGDTL